ncbi:Pumilio homolog 5 [Zea mays]|uniref:Pumilio homolog 5 n=1 Tax=Zea mays TaxID=4577 RepID=A0A1D6KJE7_MAIZE|nr:Pumilio homolog 5 [Zea mays]
MATESAFRLIGGTGARDWSKGFGAFGSSAGALSGEDLGFVDNDTGVYGGWNKSVPNRSGSAPPSMEGSLAALGHLIDQQSGSFEASLTTLDNITDSSKSEEQLRADPAYFEYYGSKVNLNPRLPPPLISRESRRLMNRVGKAKEWRMVSQDNSSKGSIYVPRSMLSTHKEEPEDDKSPRLDSSSVEDAQIVSSASNFQSQDFMLERFQQSVASSPDSSSSNPSNSNTGDSMPVYSDINLLKSLSFDALKQSDLNSWTPKGPLKSNVNNDLSSPPLSSSSYPGSKTGTQTFEQEKAAADTKHGNVVLGSGAAVTEVDNVDSIMKNLKLSLDVHTSSPAKQRWQDNVLQQYGSFLPAQGDPIQLTTQGPHPPHVPFVDNLSHAQLKLPDIHQNLPQPSMTTPFYTPNSFGNPYYQNLHPANAFPTSIGTGGYAVSGSILPPFMAGYAPQGPLATPLDSSMTPSFSGRPSGFLPAGNLTGGTDFMQSCKVYGQFEPGMQPSIPDPNFIHFFQHPSLFQYTGGNQYNTMGPRFTVVGNLAESFDSQNTIPQAASAYPSDQRLPLPITGFPNSPTARRGGTVPNYQGISSYIGVPMTYPTSPVFQGQTLPGVLPPVRRNDSAGFLPPSRNITGSPGIQGQRARQKFDESKTCSFLEELKSNRARMVELSDITGRVVEYSADQHGSRFIQQKLENCTAEEKTSVFAEILPHASALMTDVFGNYVIQKSLQFFEHGTREQRRDLATKLVGHVLPLSLQMYGCRVIQKALEVMELDQKIDLVHELDGHIMRCVRDQNGNHVIQKCIECVPTEHIGFVVSAFQGQVTSLSMHPYGCRVIQRILEHCGGNSQGQCIIDEILQWVCILAQDQYGNYVTQHVLERGKAHERSQIITKLAGQVVTMSQNKYASNVIEKCFQHGDIAERDLLIRRIVEQTEGNNNLLAMMKDQYANYVVQKILETCNEDQRELLLSRVKDHMQALRKYTYGKHIVSRVEQLCGDGTAESGS